MTLFKDHLCQIPLPRDRLYEVISDKAKCCSMRRWFRNLFVISNISIPSETLKIYKSHTAIREEREMHLKYHYYMIHPYSRFRRCWNATVVVVIFVLTIFSPIDVTFLMSYKAADPYVEALIIISQLIVTLDILLNFVTGYYDYDKKETQMDFKNTALHYIRTSLFLHLIFVIPWPWICRTQLSKAHPTIWDDGIHSRYLCAFFAVTGIFRIREVTRFVRRYERAHANSSRGLLGARFFTFCILCITIINYLACLEVSVVFMRYGDNLSNIDPRSWVIKKNYGRFHEISALGSYSMGLVRCLGAVLLNAAFNSEAETVEDCILTAIELMFGVVMMVKILVEIWLLSSSSFYMQRYAIKVNEEVKELSRHGLLTKKTYNRVLAYLMYWNELSQFKEGHIFGDLSNALKQEIKVFCSKRMVHEVAIFDHLPDAILDSIIVCLRPQTYLPGETIIRIDNAGDSMYFIQSGTVAVYSKDGIELAHLHDGSYFGEIALMTDRDTRTATVVAVEICEMHLLHKRDFRRIIHPYPELFDRMKTEATFRLQRTWNR